MHSIDDLDRKAWPPGTVRLQDLLGEAGADNKGEIILQPRPTRDPNDPLNWKRWEKYLNFGLTCYYTFMVFALIDMATPTWAPMNEQLGFSYSILNDSYAIGCGTLAIGAFCLIPFALKFGRRPVYILSTIVQLGVSVWSARLETVADLMLVNVISCFVGALSEVIVQMTIADVFFVHQRGVMNNIFVWAQNIGASLAPVAAGYMTTGQGWRWVWWWNAIFFGAGFIGFVFFYEETKYSHKDDAVIDGLVLQDPLAGEANSGRTDEETKKSDQDPEFAPSKEGATVDVDPLRRLSKVDIDPSIPRKTYRQKFSLYTSSPGSLLHFARHSYQPFMILFSIPGVFYSSLLYGALIAMSTVQVTTLSSWMAGPPYNFTASSIGLMSLAAWIGTTLGAVICGPLSDWLILLLARRNNGIYEPEMRLWLIVAFTPFVPAGIFMFGIGLNNGAPWPVIAIGFAMSNFGTVPASSLSLTYLTDAYTEIVGDALVGVSFTRNIFATILVFALTPWIAGMGIKGVYIILGIFVTVVMLSTFIFIYFGKRFRVRYADRYRYFAARQFESRPV